MTDTLSNCNLDLESVFLGVDPSLSSWSDFEVCLMSAPLQHALSPRGLLVANLPITCRKHWARGAARRAWSFRCFVKAPTTFQRWDINKSVHSHFVRAVNISFRPVRGKGVVKWWVGGQKQDGSHICAGKTKINKAELVERMGELVKRKGWRREEGRNEGKGEKMTEKKIEEWRRKIRKVN